MFVKKCSYCNKYFEKKQNVSKKAWKKQSFCSKECRCASGRIEVVCKNCEKVFTSHRFRKNTVRFCSRKCFDEHRARFPELYFSAFVKGHKCFRGKSWLKGKKMPEEIKLKISKANKGKVKPWLSERMKGKNHWNWKGGVTPLNHRIRNSNEYIEWRKKVYERDFWTCRDCGLKCNSKNIVAHHLKSFKDFVELRFVVGNGVTLCRSCHKKRHDEIGLETRFKIKNS